MSNQRYLDTPEVSSFVAQELIPGEQVRVTTRRHWYSLFLTWRIPVAVILLMAWAVWETFKGTRFADWKLIAIGCGIALLNGIFTFLKYVEWRKHQYVVTSHRVIELGGLVSKVAPKDHGILSTLQNVDSFVPPGFWYLIGGFLGMRYIVLQAGMSKVILEDAPEWLERAINEARFARPGTLPGEREEGSAGPPPPIKRRRRR